MYTRVLELKAQSRFGDDLNPLWNMCGFQNNDSTLVPPEYHLVPLDTLVDLSTHELESQNAKSFFQIYLKSPQLTESFLIKTEQLGLRLQIWFDSPVEEIQVKRLISFGFTHIEWVYCPRLLYHPYDVFPESVRSLFQELVIHLNPKDRAHDSWPDLHTLWYYWLWVKNHLNVKVFQMQTFAHVLNFQSEENRFFLLNPREKNWQVAVKTQSKFLWSLQFIPFLISTIKNAYSLTILAIKNAYLFTHLAIKNAYFFTILTIKNSYHLILTAYFITSLTIRKAYFAFTIVYFPFKKVYWFLEYQYKKRVSRRTKF